MAGAGGRLVVFERVLDRLKPWVVYIFMCGVWEWIRDCNIISREGGEIDGKEILCIKLERVKRRKCW